ncbi:hypothetical protein CC1G_10503 [Coprinopsis cinerea okayama7|uniref:Vesicle transport v-SNARE N-terminal domain-containing protein n=1 Tax=Coprinopsis cinerea (strain Okayama-7 / 130 / ATCC MYA-4618 / FGSC 9003) TaxID=240176 RepID=A8NL72_COPC7|nr:hypothetical protein CC1G_10503 [Coprinopsis cinerea okayama7\|eukprot:XP_001834629.1 hypothetical protein CC1G_10503 [Coprinopsis cinerea okayama7\
MDPTPASLFDAYEQDFVHLLQGIREKLEGDARSGHGEQRKAALRKVEIELDEADDIVSQLEIELNGIPQSLKPPYLTRLKQAKSDLNKYKKMSRELHSVVARGDLLGGARGGGAYSRGSPSGARSPHSDNPYTDNPYTEDARLQSERARLLHGSHSLSDGSRRLQDSTSLALQTEAYGAEILGTLRGQREQIEGARDMLDTADRNIDRSSNTIGKMIIQMKKQRFIIAGIIAFFVALIILILYFKLVR